MGELLLVLASSDCKNISAASPHFLKIAHGLFKIVSRRKQNDNRNSLVYKSQRTMLQLSCGISFTMNISNLL